MSWLLLTLPLLAAADFHVAPTGRDTAPGTADQPFATLARAQAACRERIAAGLTADLAVEIAAGNYELAEPLVFGPQDAGSAAHAVSYVAAPGATVVLSGGERITGWQPEGALWTATSPRRAYRQLVVDDRAAMRARQPNSGYLRLRGAELTPDRSRYTLMLEPAQVAAWDNVGEVEVVVLGNWEIVRKKLAAVDPATGEIELAPPHAGAHDAMRPGPGRPGFLENAREFLDQPGEWYHDAGTGQVWYYPREGEDLTTAVVTVPRLTRLLEINGTADDPVRNLHFVGLRLAHADWAFPAYGFNGAQASFGCYPQAGQTGWDWYPWEGIEPASVWWYAEGCSFSDGALEHLGGVGIRLREGCRDCRIEGNVVRDIGASGIMVGEDLSGWAWGKEEYPTAKVPTGNRIANNLVHDCGTADFGAVGIWAGFTDGTVIAHNEVHHLPYSGISVGWRWDDVPTVCANNQIVANHVYDVLRILCDGGCLYTLGRQPGTVIKDNLFHDAVRSAVAHGAPNNGIFFDQGSRGFDVEGNLIYATSGAPIRFNLCEQGWHTWADNTFGLATAAPGKRGPALLCDGSSACLEVPHRPELDSPQLSAEAWVQVAATPEGEDARRWVVNKNPNEWAESHWGLCTQSDQVGAYLNIGGGQAHMIELWSEPGVVTLDAWHHLAMSYDGQDLRVYCDGREVAAKAVGLARKPGTGPLAIGRRADSYNYFKGLIDEVAVYPRALTAAEIEQRFRADGAPPAAELGAAGYWGFDDLADAVEVLEAARARAGLEAPYRARLRAE